MLSSIFPEHKGLADLRGSLCSAPVAEASWHELSSLGSSTLAETALRVPCVICIREGCQNVLLLLTENREGVCGANIGPLAFIYICCVWCSPKANHVLDAYELCP